MNYSPEERQKIAKILRQKGRYTDTEVERIVNLCLRLAPELLKIWKKAAHKQGL